VYVQLVHRAGGCEVIFCLISLQNWFKSVSDWQRRHRMTTLAVNSWAGGRSIFYYHIENLFDRVTIGRCRNPYATMARLSFPSGSPPSATSTRNYHPATFFGSGPLVSSVKKDYPHCFLNKSPSPRTLRGVGTGSTSFLLYYRQRNQTTAVRRWRATTVERDWRGLHFWVSSTSF